jgi:hypothetical protein
MPDAPPNLLYGHYRPPLRVELDSYLPCAIRGRVKVVAISNPPMCWPIGKQDGKLAPVVYRGLLRALQREEPAEAIAAAWCIDVATVAEWRKALGVVTFAERQAAHQERLPRFTMKVTPTPEPSKPVRMPRSGNQPYKGHIWTPEEDALVRMLPAKEVAERINVSHTTVRKRRKHLGVGLHQQLRS